MRFGAALVAVLACLFFALPAAAEQHGYLVSVVGRVLSVDRAHGTILLRHGMLETTPAGREVCVVPRKLLRYFRPGMDLTATADTSRRPWRLREVQHFHADGNDRPTRATARVALGVSNGDDA